MAFFIYRYYISWRRKRLIARAGIILKLQRAEPLSEGDPPSRTLSLKFHPKIARGLELSGDLYFVRRGYRDRFAAAVVIGDTAFRSYCEKISCQRLQHLRTSLMHPKLTAHFR
jgi:hypothetical protein